MSLKNSLSSLNPPFKQFFAFLRSLTELFKCDIEVVEIAGLARGDCSGAIRSS